MLLMTQSVLSWGGPVFHWLWKHMGIGVGRSKRRFPWLGSLHAASHSVTKSKAMADIYGRLNLALTRSVARATLARGV